MNKEFSYKNLLKTLALLTTMFLSSFSTQAGDVVWSQYLQGPTAIVNTAELNMSDFILRSKYNKTDYSYKVSLVYGKELKKDIQGSGAWSSTVQYSISFYDKDMVLQNQTTGNTLSISYDPANPGGITAEAHVIFNTPAVDFETVRLKITSAPTVTGTMPADVRLELSLINRSVFDYTGATPLLDYQSNKLFWSYIKGADYYQVEYVYIDNEDQHTAFATNADAFAYKEPVRIVLKDQYFDKFNLTYPAGKIYFRMRGVGKYTGVVSNSESVTPWYYVASPLTIGTNFEASKNWQYVTTYAEDAKYKKVITYYDGTLRNRQVLTNLSSEDIVLAGETKYDYEGRPVVNILPAPLSQTTLGYYNNLNTFTNAKSGYDKTMVTTEAESLTVASKAYIYYSALNPSINNSGNQYIPDAEGYPFSQVLYTRDGTGRPLMQSGVGKVFHLGDPTLPVKNTRYKYSTANDTELHRLFGSNVGRAAHYKKNYVIDPNGQISVSYLDQEERVVATCLTGNTPANLDTLASNVSFSINVSLNGSNRVDKAYKISKSVSIINNILENTVYTFNYDLKGVINQSTLIPGFCKECVYDLVFTIKDPDNVVAYTQTVSGIQPSVLSCATNNYDKLALINTPVTFAKTGEYQVIKELRLNSGALDAALTTIKTQPGYPSLSTFEQTYLDKIDIGNCDNSCEDNCRTEILRQNSAWKADPVTYAGQIDTAVAICISTYCPSIIASAAVNVTTDECKSIYDQIIEQIRPGGVFNTNNTWVDNAITTILGNGGFKDAVGVVLSTPTRIQIQTSAGFNDDWLDELASQHREYCHYQNCIVLIPSKNFDKTMAMVNDWTEATAKGYTGTYASLLDKDPMFDQAAIAYAPANNARNNILGRMQIFTTAPSLQFLDTDADGFVSLKEYVNSYVPYGTNTLFTPDPVLKWRTYRSLYNGLKVDEEQRLTGTTAINYGVPGTLYKSCSYFADGNAIMQNPSQPSSMAQINQLNDQSIMQGCQSLCPENAKVWLSMIENNCGEISDADSISIYNLLLSYCNSSCGYLNPLGLLLTGDINSTLLQSVQTILNKPEYNSCLLSSIAIENPYEDQCSTHGLKFELWHFTFPDVCHTPTLVVTFPNSTANYVGAVSAVDFTTFSNAYYGPFLTAAPNSIDATSTLGKISGILNITDADSYNFKFTIDNAVKLYIDGTSIINEPFSGNLCTTGLHTSTSSGVYLSKGYHNIYIEFANLDLSAQFKLEWKKTSESTFGLIPTDNYFLNSNDVNYGTSCSITGLIECPADLNSDNDCDDNPVFISTCGENVINAINALIQKSTTGGNSNSYQCSFPLPLYQPKNVLVSGCSNFVTQTMVEVPNICNGEDKNNILVARDVSGFRLFSGNNATAYQSACICDPGSAYHTTTALSQVIKFYTLDISGNPVYINSADVVYVNNPTVDCDYVYSDVIHDFESSLGIKVTLGRYTGVGDNIEELYAYVEASSFTTGTSYMTWKVPGLTPNTLCNNTYTINWATIKTDCIEKLNNTARYEAYVAWKEAEDKFISNYLNEQVNRCLSNPFSEDLSYSYSNNEYHYTLYYYDQAGNLIQTVPPAGVNPLGSSAFTSKGVYIAGNEPDHKLTTKYRYNSLNQLVNQYTPDGGTTYFWYDSKGQLRLSQNDKQLAASAPDSLNGNRYSYTRYDRQARIMEVGQVEDLNKTRYYLNNLTNEKDVLALLDNGAFPVAASQVLTQITTTTYDAGDALQDNLRGRVSTVSSNTNETTTDVVTLYSYDPHGNVKNLRQNITGFGTKQTDYCYDLISGKVNKVYYQMGQSDQFVHQYEYDSDNRIKSVYTSADDVVWEEDARYFYYQHGPLSRVELGHNKVQGLDYYYTLQGWLKGVNIPALRTADATGKPRVTADPGLDGITATNNFNKYVGQDEMAFALGYFNGEYKPIQAGMNFYAASDNNWTSMSNNIRSSGLYNGNIANMVTQLHSMGPKLTPNAAFQVKEQSGLHAYAYHYDQLNRITRGAHYSTYDNSTGWAARAGTPVSSPQPFDARYSYDANGNITAASINGQTTGLMDNLTYNYNSSGGFLVNNRLNYVADAAGKTESADLPGGQLLNNYQYDAIGNLTSDLSEEISQVNWSVYGKVLSVLNSNNAKNDITFVYDGAGNRVKKVALIPGGTADITYYIRDASGNTMATYEQIGAATTTEYSIYGSSRLGTWQSSTVTNGVLRRIPSLKNYELSNHLGNVLVTISALKIGVDLNSDSYADYYIAQAQNGRDYYPFGMTMPGRSFNSGAGYRFGFNGQEKDIEFHDNYDFGARIYDTRLGKMLSMEPQKELLFGYSPYIFSLNTPIQAIDEEGEFPILINGNTFGGDIQRGSSSYWDSGIIKTIESKLGYKFGGEKTGTSSSTSNSRFSGDFFFVDGNRGVGGGRAGNVYLMNHNTPNISTPGSRAAAGSIVAKTDAQAVWAKLKKSINKDGLITEKIQVFTHSRGAAFGNAYVNALRTELLALAEKEKVGFAYDKGLIIDLTVHLAPHQSNFIHVPNSKTTTVALSKATDLLSGDDMGGDVFNIEIAGTGSNTAGHGTPGLVNDLSLIIDAYKDSGKNGLEVGLNKSYAARRTANSRGSRGYNIKSPNK